MKTYANKFLKQFPSASFPISNNLCSCILFIYYTYTMSSPEKLWLKRQLRSCLLNTFLI